LSKTTTNIYPLLKRSKKVVSNLGWKPQLCDGLKSLYVGKGKKKPKVNSIDWIIIFQQISKALNFPLFSWKRNKDEKENIFLSKCKIISLLWIIDKLRNFFKAKSRGYFDWWWKDLVINQKKSRLDVPKGV